MKVLITGGAGFVGSNLAQELVNEHEVIIVDNFHTGSMNNLCSIRNDVKVIKASCEDILNIDLPRLDFIFHLGIPSSSPMYKDDSRLAADALRGAISVFDLAKTHHVEKVVYASSSSIYSGLDVPFKEDMQPLVSDYYTEARISIERFAKLYHTLHGMNSIGLRFFSIYGRHEESKGKYANIVSQFLWEMRVDRSPVLYGNGEQTRDFTFVADVVRSLKRSMDIPCGCDVVNIGAGKSHSFREVVDILNGVLGKNINPSCIENPIGNYVNHTCADTTKMRQFLGFVPEYSLERGIRELLNGNGR